MGWDVNTTYNYEVGGCLPLDAPTYVVRQADDELYNGVLTGKFCYVLNSRQMGKSSLRVRTMKRLQAKGIRCAAIDLTSVGCQDIPPEQWYAGITYTLASSLNLLESVDLKTWWSQHELLAPVQRFGTFIREILLQAIQEDVAIFIDEIDSILSLNFPVDDFFALIRFCHEQRVENPEYQRLTWVLLGVAAPLELIQDRQRTPFDVGQSISLTGFQLQECSALERGLARKASNPQTTMTAILDWTGGKPFLTQKLCQLVLSYVEWISAGQEAKTVEMLARSRILENWEARDEPPHLKTIRDRLLQNNNNPPGQLRLYQQILHQGEILADSSPEQMSLRLSGLAVQLDSGKHYPQPVLKAYNRIYESIFNVSWVEEQLRKLDPTPDTEIYEEIRSKDEQFFYDYWLYWVAKEPPEALLERFRQLFIDGIGCSTPEIEMTLYRLVTFLKNDRDFIYILNRTCTILINHWHLHHPRHNAVFQLIELLEKGQPRLTQMVSRSFIVRRLQELRKLFLKSQDFLSLQRLVQVIEPSRLTKKTTSLGKLIDRYPFLYSHCLIPEKSTFGHRQIIQTIQSQKQKDFSVNLSQYAAHLARKASKKSSSVTVETAVRKSITNPTLLSDRQLYFALKHFVGKVDGVYTYRDSARGFLTQTNQKQSYQTFKTSLYEYLLETIESRYGSQHFNERLYKQLQETFPEKDLQPLDSFLIAQTCSSLFKFLVEDPEHPNFYVFLDLIFNLGTSRTIGLLLKITLIAQPVKPHLEKRFSVLFNYYESKEMRDIDWLVEALENLNVALSSNFGDADLSFFKYL
ncbi:AAA-like domain-containing protein [Lusitaniella coriacea LEGE 07157]|uniref:AAA-like domain-containing protein n=1 Tax=Lusitaniella coriacea LEGE 07157 TaxID=945747 RepID=A0A8J7DVT5_9CYAN|nr:AAA-like domain-containing protein [Lusitaniella coriacea]MBE9116034.1 AAA-like domain-containing protein [Lusitaniella coriacea LEGE 07157]